MENAVTPSVDLIELVRMFEDAEVSTQSARGLAERDRDYYDSKQWTSEEEAALKKRNQPVVTFNRIQRKVNYLKGLEAQTRKDPKCFPREPGDDGSAQAATDALRYVCDDQDWDAKRSEAFESIMVEGTGAVMVGVSQTRNGVDPSLVCIPWDRLIYDPYSRRVDFSDASFMGIVTWLDMDEAVRRFPHAKDAIESTWTLARDSETYDDRPKHNLWADYKRKRVRLVEMYFLRDGQWMAATFTRGGYLIEPTPSPYLDEEKQPENPIKAISAYVDRDNNRYGEVRAMISPQDEINKRRSKGLHLINSRQVRVDPRFEGEASSIKRELAKPDGVIFAGDGEIEVLQTGDMAAANFQMLQEAKSEIDLLGPNAALAGKNENQSSGRALLAQQQGGMVEVALLMDRLRQLSLAVYRSIWARIKQRWDGPRWIRVTGDERNLQWVGLNVPKTMLDVARERLKDDPMAEQKLALLAQDPMAQQVMEVTNPVAEMDVDIVIDEGMDTPTVQAEQFDTFAKMMPSLIRLPPAYAKMMVTLSSMRDKDKALQLIEEMEKAQQQPNPMMQAQQQLAIQGMQAEVENTQSQTAKNLADAEAKKAGIVTDMMNAQQGQDEKLALAEQKQAHGMMLAERKQMFNEQMAARSAQSKREAA